MALAKVIVASEWEFTEPKDIRTLFNSTPLGHDKNIEYDQANHQFVIDCPVNDTEAVVSQMVKIIKKYADEQDDEFVPEDLGDGRKLRPLVDSDMRDVSPQDLIWRQVDEMMAQGKEPTGPKPLLASVTGFKTGIFPHRDMEAAFSKTTLTDIAQASSCTVDLDITNLHSRVRVVGWTEREVEAALRLLDAAEAEYLDKMSRTAYDFVDSEGQQEPHFRFQRPRETIDVELFERGMNPLCELMMVEWDPTSRFYRSTRKERVPLEYSSIKRLMWVKPLEFHYTEEKNNPINWLNKQEAMPHPDASLPRMGRTEKWIEEVNDPDKSRQVAAETTRANQPRKPVKPGEDKDGAPRKSIVAPRPFDERIKDESDSDDSSVFEPLQGPSRAVCALTDTKGRQWSRIIGATLEALDSASELHKRALSFEICIGKAYVHTVSLRNEAYRPQRGKHAQVFKEDDWPNVFRIRPKQYGAHTRFSKKLSQNVLDAEFILNMKLRGGENLFEPPPMHKRAYFEIVCFDVRTQVEAVIELVDRGQGSTIEGTNEAVGTINFHYPGRAWDSSWQLTGRRQAFPQEQQAVFSTFVTSAFVTHDPEHKRDPELYTQRHERVTLRSVRLIRESVHRAPNEIALVLRQVKTLEVQNMGEQMFKASALEETELVEQHKVWWEAKLVMRGIQLLLSENKHMEMGKTASWRHKDDTKEQVEGAMKLMLELGQHIVQRIDNVGYTQSVRVDKGATTTAGKTVGSGTGAQSQVPNESVVGEPGEKTQEGRLIEGFDA